MEIFTTEQFRTAVQTISNRRHDWKVSEFMSTLQFHIVTSSRKGNVHDNVYSLYFMLYTRLTGTTVSRSKITKTIDEILWL
jgi:hypothetical protein